MRFFTGLLIAAAIGLTTPQPVSAQEAQGPYVSAEGGYSADFSAPVRSHDSASEIRGQMVSYWASGARCAETAACVVVAVQIPDNDPERDTPDAWLQTNLGSFLQTGPSTLLSSKPVTAVGLQGLDYVARSPDGSIAEGRVLFRRDRAFFITVQHQGDPGALPTAIYQHFVGSFALIGG